MKEPVKITSGYDFPEYPDYMSFVDADIRAMFEGKGGYFLSDVLYAQLIKELRKLNEKHNSALSGWPGQDETETEK